MTRVAKPRAAGPGPSAAPPRARDPYGIGPVGSWIAPVLSGLGLVLVGVLTFSLLNGEVPFAGTGRDPGDGSNGGVVGPAATPAPSNVVVVPEEATLEGSIVYAKGGNVWIQTNEDVRQLTDTGGASMPSWSADGNWIYYVHNDRVEGKWRVKGVVETYALDVSELMRVRSDGSAKPQRLLRSRFKRGNLTYAYWIRQPVLSPDGKKVAVMSDAPNPDDSTVVLQFFDTKSKKLKKADVGVKGVLGHQDPEWRPDGRFLLYVRNGRDGSRGAPNIMRYNVARGTTKSLTGPGYLHPAYSADGRFIAATKTSAIGTDIVILDGATGRELLRVTGDGSSWAPTWSPAGDGIAFLHIVGQTVDLRLAKLDGTAPDWTVSETIDLTEVSGLDAASRPDWSMPVDRLPATPVPSAAPSSAAPSGATAP
jgi:dipeptidyl aminopeptidase/acylaminoacyl peptidase